ncbi:unnamed protein product [Arabis nemorensis]|uniref:Uncharacterized protein n=1 Tax=Arabis nemorensis TaxID=586526 RepID=A0A565AZ63_9BRAS|nr:unnamed protein product [Arabis nemorensis]
MSEAGSVLEKPPAPASNRISVSGDGLVKKMKEREKGRTYGSSCPIYENISPSDYDMKSHL